MCGIVGYTGSRACGDLILESLKRLEYRGYDSAGLAVYSTTTAQIEVLRAVGKLSVLIHTHAAQPLVGTTGIGHTRWATHGSPTENNAHPQVAKGVALVHNGIIENNQALKESLIQKGVQFLSDTDTEVIAHWLAEHLKTMPFIDAARATVSMLRGTFALAIMNRAEPSTLCVAKSASPLVLGLGEGENWCASDAAALLPHTRRVIFLEDGELAVLTPHNVSVKRFDGTAVDRGALTLDWTPAMAEKGGHKHYMIKEIHEQSRAIEDTLRGRFHGQHVSLSGELNNAKPPSRIMLTACGTSMHAAMIIRYWLEAIARIHTDLELASELRGRTPVLQPDSWVVGITQSGETLDTLAAIKLAKAAQAHTLAITNVNMSAIARECKNTLLTHAGPEIGVASTKCFSSQMLVGLLLAIHLGTQKGVLSRERSAALTSALIHLPALISDTLKRIDQNVRQIARELTSTRDVLFIGRGLSYPIAMEGALKLKEVSYIHAEGYAAGELKHGPIALIDADLPVIAVAPSDVHFERTVGNMQEVKARGAKVIAVTHADPSTLNHLASHIVQLPEVDPLLSPFLTVLPLQLIAYYVADAKGTDVDQPRNLAKTVTVE